MQAEEQWLALLEEQPLRFAIVHSKMADGQYVSVKDSSRKKAHYWDHTKQVAPKASIGIDKRTRFLSLRSDELLSGFGRISLQDLFASAFSWLQLLIIQR